MTFIWQSQTASGVPFDNSTNGFVSITTQAAIEEVKTYAETVARICVSAGFDGNASTGRWLEFITNVASNVSPFVTPRNLEITELAVAAGASSTVTITIYKSPERTPVTLTTISLTAQRTNRITGLAISLVAGDTIGARVTSGSASRPMVYIFGRFT